MHAAFRKSGALRKSPDALLPMFTNRVENANTFGPQSHGVGPCSEGWLQSWRKSALQNTRSTTGCPALGMTPEMTQPCRRSVESHGGHGGKRRGEIGEKWRSDQPRLLIPRLALYITSRSQEKPSQVSIGRKGATHEPANARVPWRGRTGAV